MANVLSESGHEVLIVEAEGRHLRSFPSHLLARPSVDILEAQPTLDETMIAMDIRGADIFIAALRTPAENGLAALKAKLTYGVENVVAIVTNEALGKIYERFDIRSVNPYTLALSNLRDATGIDISETSVITAEQAIAAVQNR